VIADRGFPNEEPGINRIGDQAIFDPRPVVPDQGFAMQDR